MLQAKEDNDFAVKILSFVRDKLADSDEEPPESKPAVLDGEEEEPQDADNASSSDTKSECGKAKKAYKPHIPGRVLYIYRSASCKCKLPYVSECVSK